MGRGLPLLTQVMTLTQAREAWSQEFLQLLAGLWYDYSWVREGETLRERYEQAMQGTACVHTSCSRASSIAMWRKCGITGAMVLRIIGLRFSVLLGSEPLRRLGGGALAGGILGWQ